MTEGSSYICEYPGCERHPSRGDAIFRTSPKGGPFRGRCHEHLDVPLPPDMEDFMQRVFPESLRGNAAT